MNQGTFRRPKHETGIMNPREQDLKSFLILMAKQQYRTVHGRAALDFVREALASSPTVQHPEIFNAERTCTIYLTSRAFSLLGYKVELRLAPCYLH